MKCAVHHDVDAVGYCRNCGKALCGVCARPIRDVYYCEDCLAGAVGIPAATPAASPYVQGATAYNAPVGSPAGVPVPPPRVAGSPALAFILGLVPGLGAIYNGEYNKALIHIVVFAAIIAGLNSGLGAGGSVALSLLLVGFEFYMALDAMRTLKARQIGETAVDPLESWSKNRPIGPIILIGLGVIFLLDNFSVFSFFQIDRLWPLILIGAGAVMFRDRLARRG
jgi:Domain of unknown function (DUF5668)